ncbi:hypothetical protein BD410DRAFT_901494 [Rickenella mellea]|uniref:Uncharacterized protein n=1 Tax=Rickenella mellea TaxID=50990 RepID=A0A4Y7PQM2_9AGAM|nr:hypothetical protein BD410DRAFT_901494 [Rickenella mellea]
MQDSKAILEMRSTLAELGKYTNAYREGTDGETKNSKLDALLEFFKLHGIFSKSTDAGANIKDDLAVVVVLCGISTELRLASGNVDKLVNSDVNQQVVDLFENTAVRITLKPPDLQIVKDWVKWVQDMDKDDHNYLKKFRAAISRTKGKDELCREGTNGGIKIKPNDQTSEELRAEIQVRMMIFLQGKLSLLQALEAFTLFERVAISKPEILSRDSADKMAWKVIQSMNSVRTQSPDTMGNFGDDLEKQIHSLKSLSGPEWTPHFNSNPVGVEACKSIHRMETELQVHFDIFKEKFKSIREISDVGHKVVG